MISVIEQMPDTQCHSISDELEMAETATGAVTQDPTIADFSGGKSAVLTDTFVVLAAHLHDHDYAKPSSSSSIDVAVTTRGTSLSHLSDLTKSLSFNAATETKARLYYLMSSALKPTKRNQPCPVRNVDTFTKDAIRRTIYGFSKSEGCMLNLNNLLRKLHEESIFTGGRDTLRKILHDIGFRFHKTQNNRAVLQEKEDIQMKRLSYLRKMAEYRSQGKKVYYTDETYVHLSLHSMKEWSDGSSCGQNPPIGKGAMFIIIHCGGADGWIDGALKIWRSGGGDIDYHSKMDHQTFSHYVDECLIPKLEKGSVLVMDNASYHNFKRLRKPTKSRTKKDMVQWLKDKGMNVNDKLTKDQIFQQVQSVPDDDLCDIDRRLTEAGIIVERLPPYHPELNPIENVWGTVKGKIASRNIEFKAKKVEEIAKEEFAKITVEHWRKYCEHVIKTENILMQSDGLCFGSEVRARVKPVVIELSDSESDSDLEHDGSASQINTAEGELENDHQPEVSEFEIECEDMSEIRQSKPKLDESDEKGTECHHEESFQQATSSTSFHSDSIYNSNEVGLNESKQLKRGREISKPQQRKRVKASRRPAPRESEFDLMDRCYIEAHNTLGSLLLNDSNLTEDLVETVLRENWDSLKASFDYDMRCRSPMPSKYNSLLHDFVPEPFVKYFFHPLALKVGDRWEQGLGCEIIQQKLVPELAAKVFERVFHIDSPFEFITLQSRRHHDKMLELLELMGN